MYAYMFKNYWKKVNYVSSSKIRVEDTQKLVDEFSCELNCEYVIYNDTKLEEYYKDENTVMVVNTRKGLENLYVKINKMKFNKIVLIGCCRKFIEKDLVNLSEKYRRVKVNVYEAYPGINLFIYVSIFAPI